MAGATAVTAAAIDGGWMEVALQSDSTRVKNGDVLHPIPTLDRRLTTDIIKGDLEFDMT